MSGKLRHGIEQTEAGLRPQAGFHLIDNRLTQHLIAAADPQQRNPLLTCLQDARRHPRVAQPQQIAQRIFTAGQDNQIGLRQLLRVPHVAHADIRLRRQRVEIGEV